MNRSLVLFLGLLSATPAAGRSATEASATAPLPPGALTSSDHSDEWKSLWVIPVAKAGERVRPYRP
jgi:hypothetical protein